MAENLKKVGFCRSRRTCFFQLCQSGNNEAKAFVCDCGNLSPCACKYSVWLCVTVCDCVPAGTMLRSMATCGEWRRWRRRSGSAARSAAGSTPPLSLTRELYGTTGTNYGQQAYLHLSTVSVLPSWKLSWVGILNLYCEERRDIRWNIAWARGKSQGRSRRDFPRDQSIFHRISRLESQYRHSQLQLNIGSVDSPYCSNSWAIRENNALLIEG
jgi:hypothetical protein